jgi:hypothetical protein
MLDDEYQLLTITAAEARDRVTQLESERAPALTTGLAGDATGRG